VAIGVFFEVLAGHSRTIVPLTIAGIRYQWIAVGDFSVDVSALVDPLSAVMLLVVTVVSFLIFVYSNGYMAHDHGFYRFFTWLSLFVFAMLILVMADNYLLLFVGWEGVGLCSYLLIGFWFERLEPYYAATMVTAGVYLVARSVPLFTAAGSVLTVVAVVGTLTAIFAATIALVQFDIKRVMAYSTVSQLGYMFLALGVGAPIAAIFHLA